MAVEIKYPDSFTGLRYAQCWEDADVLLEALDVRQGDVCVSIASGGDNTLALLARNPSRVVAIDFNPAQIACLELRVAAYAALSWEEMLELLGFRDGNRRRDLYARCRGRLSPGARSFWDASSPRFEAGIGSMGRFERYLAMFRNHVLPLAHPRKRIARLLRCRTQAEREAFYAFEWDNRRWRILFRTFFSRFVMARLGRHTDMFRYVDSDVAERILVRTRYALTVLNPAENPYLQWILTGRYEHAMPFALRRENFEAIRENLDCLEWRCGSLEDFLEQIEPRSIDRFNLSDVFEYMSCERYEHTLARISRALRPGARIAYWNLLVPRRRPESLAQMLRPLEKLAANLHARDKAFFYNDFVLEEAA